MVTSVQKVAHPVATQDVCKLCGKWRELRRSHVLSDMAYADVIDPASHPRMVVVRDVDKGRVSDKSQQTGFRERLLCEECERQFSRYETYAAMATTGAFWYFGVSCSNISSRGTEFRWE